MKTAIGIDLGTTYSAIAIMQDGNPTMMMMEFIVNWVSRMLIAISMVKHVERLRPHLRLIRTIMNIIGLQQIVFEVPE